MLIEARRVSEKLAELEARENEESKSNKVAVRRKALLRVKLSFGLCTQREELVLLTGGFWLICSPDLAHFDPILVNSVRYSSRLS